MRGLLLLLVLLLPTGDADRDESSDGEEEERRDNEGGGVRERYWDERVGLAKWSSSYWRWCAIPGLCGRLSVLGWKVQSATSDSLLRSLSSWRRCSRRRAHSRLRSARLALLWRRDEVKDGESLPDEDVRRGD